MGAFPPGQCSGTHIHSGLLWLLSGFQLVKHQSWWSFAVDHFLRAQDDTFYTEGIHLLHDNWTKFVKGTVVIGKIILWFSKIYSVLLKHAPRKVNQLVNTPLYQLILGIDFLSQFFEMEVQVGTDKLEVVASFCYVRDMLSAASGCELSVVCTALVSYLCGLALRIWTSFWRREGSVGMDMWNVPMVQSNSLWNTVWWKAWSCEAQDDMEAADRDGLQSVAATISVEELRGNNLQNDGLTPSLQKSIVLLTSLEEITLMLLVTNWQRMMQRRCQWVKTQSRRPG